MFDTGDKNDSSTRARIIFVALVSKSTIIVIHALVYHWVKNSYTTAFSFLIHLLNEFYL